MVEGGGLECLGKQVLVKCTILRAEKKATLWYCVGFKIEERTGLQFVDSLAAGPFIRIFF